MPRMTPPAHPWRRRLLVAGGLLAVAAFAALAGRFWHPYYGFTRFVQLDAADAAAGVREVREYPIFTYEGFNGYDGAAYVQIAYHPLLDSLELQPALGNVPYRARRILGSALAWVLSAGDPARIAHTYAALNLAVWLAFAALLWRVLPVTGARSFAAWAGVMFSAGALHAVRLALTDLLAATLVTAALALGERARKTGALGVLATAGLARETALAAVVALWRGPWNSARAWAVNMVRGGLVALPLAAWMAYVRWKAGPAPQGLGNFTWPVIGWIEKWHETFAAFGQHPEFRWLTTTTLLALIGLTAQAAFLLTRRRVGDAWWRMGFAGVAMMAMLGTAVWEGHPGAATRVLLPMGVAFAVLAVRERAGWGWLAAGGLTVFSGLLALGHVPDAPRELAAGRYPAGAYVARLGAGWFGVERDGRNTWAWSGREAALEVEMAPRDAAVVPVRLKIRAITPRPIEVRDAAGVVWREKVGERPVWIDFRATPRERGRLVLELRSAAAPVKENDHADARELGFALYGVALQ
jgi:hypothetical protein